MFYEVQVAWDEEALVWYIEDSNVLGLVGEAQTLESMVSLVKDRIPEMLRENGVSVEAERPIHMTTTAYLSPVSCAA